MITFATLVSAGLVYFFNVDIQGYVGALISLLILKQPIEILRDMYNHLLGVRADDDLIRNIKETIAQHPNVGGVYDLVLNSYGPGEVIGSVHISLPDTMTEISRSKLTNSSKTQAAESASAVGFF